MRDYKGKKENRNDKIEKERERGKELLFIELFVAFRYSTNISPLQFKF